MDKQMWVEKYRPRTVVEVLGNVEAKAAFLKWLKKSRKQKAALLFGPAGVGKTALVHAAAHDLKYNVIEMNASDTRTGKAIMAIASPVVSLSSLDEFSLGKKGSLLLFDEVDGIFGREDKGGVGAIVKIIKETKSHIVLTANNPDILKLRPIARVSHLIKFRGVRIPLLVVILQKICLNEGISAERAALETIAQYSRGDVRSAINDLQTLCNGKNIIRKDDIQRIPTRNRNLDAYQTLRGAFSADSPQDAWAILRNSLIDYDKLLLAIHDNLPLRYSNLVNLAAAYDTLSLADVFMGRIEKEMWRLLPYVYDLLAQAVTISPETFRPFDIEFPPTKFILLRWTKRERAILDDICVKIGKKCHVSKRKAKLDFLPFLRVIFKTESDWTTDIAEWLGLGKETVEYLRRVT